MKTGVPDKTKLKPKTQTEDLGPKFGVLGKDLSNRFAKAGRNQSYSWRGGRNGSGKP